MLLFSEIKNDCPERKCGLTESIFQAGRRVPLFGRMTTKLYDVFISHAYEDKNEFTNTLALALKKKGLKIWYCGIELKLGDSITESVNDALHICRFGVVLISRVYLGKRQALKELKILFAIDDTRKILLPVLHGITPGEIKKHLPALSGRYAIASDKGVTIVVNRILLEMNGKRKYIKSAERESAGAAKTKDPKGKAAKVIYKKKDGPVIVDSGFIMLGGNVNIQAKKTAARKIKDLKK